METTRKNLRRFVSTPLWIVLLLLALGFASALAGSSMDRGESAPQEEQLRVEEEVIQATPPKPSLEKAPRLGPVLDTPGLGPLFDGMTLEAILQRGQEDDC